MGFLTTFHTRNPFFLVPLEIAFQGLAKIAAGCNAVSTLPSVTLGRAVTILIWWIANETRGTELGIHTFSGSPVLTSQKWTWCTAQLGPETGHH